jgi:NO-binding membrane sensor protein with MHYT domain
MDFNLEGLGVNAFTLVGTYTAKTQLGGTLSYTGGTTDTFTSTYDTDYDLTPSLATIVGTYSGEAVTVESINPEAATVTIAAGGAITGAGADGCSFTGMVSTHAKGNVYNVSVTFNGGVCTNGTNTVTGVAYYIAAQKELISTALNSGRTNGFLFLGTKP